MRTVYEQGLELPNFFTSNMVLQRRKPHVIWGKAAAGTSLTVSLTNGSVASRQDVTSDSEGNWTASLNPLPAGGPYTLTVTAGSTTETVTDVFVGDVFVLAGQSNIQQDYQRFREHGIDPNQVPSLPTDPLIKHVSLATIDASSPQFNIPFRDDSRTWLSLHSTNHRGVSVLGLFFAERQLTRNPGIPIGLMSVSWGGTRIERWVRSAPENHSALFAADDGSIFNNHIAPFIKYKIAGILWYQGESDWNNGTMYSEAFPTMINDFRSLWGEEDLPFVYAQLARYSGYDFTAVREAQRLALDNVNNPANLGMVVTIDTDKGTSDNLHPLGKETIGERMSLMMEYMISGNSSSTVYTGPLFQSANVSGNSIIVEFKPGSIGGGLAVQDVYDQNGGGSLQEFEVAGSNGIFHKATATIAANHTVEVSSDSVPSPVYVRYAYSRVPANPNLFNKEGLPASPFTSQSLG
ncbi:sialate O-acetylesterase [Paenibacillus koleovorans]|uniref:sialate O-acetylesterase n=1 Tax=Paenibacillus koleovorans TaxID=121608 RepID=UPI0013E3577C|nr:sialate O-acetylesterase [Paenibacillus koleovorans]